jgi:hypothetical protein
VLDPEAVQITEVVGDNVVLSGDTSGIQAGDVIVSAEGKGLLRRVESITPVAGGVELITSQATLEDLFDYAKMEHAEPLPYEVMTEFIPAMEDIELSRVDPPAEAAGLRHSSADLSTGWIHLTLATNLHENLQVAGTISFNSGVDQAPRLVLVNRQLDPLKLACRDARRLEYNLRRGIPHPPCSAQPRHRSDNSL